MVASTAETLTMLARMRDPGKRHELALGVTTLCVARPLAPTAEPIAGELLITLSDSAPIETRTEMAQKLAVCDWAPQEAVKHFAFDEIEVARIIIKKSKRLTEQDMIQLATDASFEHRRTLATRHNLALSVTDTLAAPAEPLILRALANNDTAEISENTLEICLTAAKDHIKLREALARRHDLSTEYATQLCIMLPENWREELYRRFGLDKTTVEGLAIEAALETVDKMADDEAERAVAEAVEAGILDGDFILSALKSDNEALFDHAIAHKCGLTVAQWRVAVTMGGVRAAAMACQAAGLDRTAYPIIHRALQRAGRIHQTLEGDAMTAAANVFRMYGPEKAAKVLRQMGSRV